MGEGPCPDTAPKVFSCLLRKVELDYLNNMRIKLHDTVHQLVHRIPWCDALLPC